MRFLTSFTARDTEEETGRFRCFIIYIEIKDSIVIENELEESVVS